MASSPALTASPRSPSLLSASDDGSADRSSCQMLQGSVQTRAGSCAVAERAVTQEARSSIGAPTPTLDRLVEGGPAKGNGLSPAVETAPFSHFPAAMASPTACNSVIMHDFLQFTLQQNSPPAQLVTRRQCCSMGMQPTSVHSKCGAPDSHCPQNPYQSLKSARSQEASCWRFQDRSLASPSLRGHRHMAAPNISAHAKAAHPTTR